MTVLQIGAEAKLLTSERYSFTCAFNSPALIWRDQERQQELGKGRVYLAISDLENVKRKLIKPEVMLLCCEKDHSRSLVQAPL